MNAEVQMTREEIEIKINANAAEIARLRNENFELRIQSYKTSDDKRWYTEKLETVGRGKTKRETTIGRIHWMQDFTDEDTGEKIAIERHEVVLCDGKWFFQD